LSNWRNLSGPSTDIHDLTDNRDRNGARQSVACREQIFNTRAIAISGVSGLNDLLNVPVLQGTCTTCHDAPNVGNHSVPLAINIGISDASRRTPDMPLYTLRNKITGATVRTTDPGRALITGKWADIGKFKDPCCGDSSGGRHTSTTARPDRCWRRWTSTTHVSPSASPTRNEPTSSLF
jgi:hypothetical protein